MQPRFHIPLLFLLLLQLAASAQTCTTLGQNPSTAFPVCGLSTFAQNNVPICGGITVPSQCVGPLFADRNPFWYKFTCFTAGTLGFAITPNNITDDYDWQIFDVTGHDPNDVYSDPTLFVCCDWTGDGGITGASAAGTLPNGCDGFGQPLFTAMPTLILGHNYLLLISHFTNSQSGYSLSFGGGTAVITDPDPPTIEKVKAGCTGTEIYVKLSKRMKCSSLTASGSEFTVSPTGGATVSSAVGFGCSNSFDMDSVIVTLSNPLPPGNYTLTVQNGTDGNTILDNCGVAVPVGNNGSFTVMAAVPTLMDSISPVPCAATSIQLVFKQPILCSSIAADGSDFTITGPAPVTIANASGNCGAGSLSSNTLTVGLSAPISVAGTYQIKLVTGSDGNTLFNECAVATPTNSILSFLGLSAANAAFSFQIAYGCKQDTVTFLHNAGNGVNQWKWTFDDNTSSTVPNPFRYYTVFGAKPIKLWVTNGICNDSIVQTVDLLNDSVRANFSAPAFLCPEDQAIFVDSSKGTIAIWNWDFSNGSTSSLQVPPPQTYAPVPQEKKITVRLIAKGVANCYDTAYRSMKLIPNCTIDVPTAFTPNGDGLNDYLYPLHAYKADKLTFRVYNRYGQLVFSTTDWLRKWDGTFSGQPQDTGVYAWMLQYTHHDTGRQVFQKGTTVLIR